MAINAAIGNALDQIRQTRGLLDAVVAADQLRDQQIADLKAQIANLQVGEVLTDEDKAGLAEIANDIADVNTALAAAVPENTVAPAPVTANPNSPDPV